MPVLLTTSHAVRRYTEWDRWVAVAGAAPDLDPSRRLPDTARRLEAAFGDCRDAWWALARRLQETPSSDLAHAACCNPSPSDMGAMLAWSRLIAGLAEAPSTTLAVCDDPWLFRELAELERVAPGAPPALWKAAVAGYSRGVFARLRAALRVFAASLILRRHRRRHAGGAPALLVYGHPNSGDDGRDAYFGDLMIAVPELVRALHTDCGRATAGRLGGEARTASLHAWGSPWYALGVLPFARWRPSRADRAGRHGWLVRRAAAMEGRGAAAAMTRWQVHCQGNWLREARPSTVIWPWENQPWERPLVRAARKLGVRSIGYQHTIVGRHMWNQSPKANRDGQDAVPDMILCNGPGYRVDLLSNGVAADRLKIAGSFRFRQTDALPYDPNGPVFVALSSNRAVSAELMIAVAQAAEAGYRFSIKDHPMYPFPFAETDRMRRTTAGLHDQPPLSGVVYSASAVGLEAHLGGLPTVRFRPSSQPAVDILPNSVELPVADHGTLAQTLDGLERRPAPAWTTIFEAVDIDLWHRELGL